MRVREWRELGNLKLNFSASLRTFVAKIAWDDMPILSNVKGLAETVEAGLTSIMEDEEFVFFSKEQIAS